MRKNWFSKKIFFFNGNHFSISPPPPKKTPKLNVVNSIKREMKWERIVFLNRPPPPAHPHDMVHVPAQFQNNTVMRFWVTVWKLNGTDRQGPFQYLPSQAFGRREIKKFSSDCFLIWHTHWYGQEDNLEAIWVYSDLGRPPSCLAYRKSSDLVIICFNSHERLK